MKMIYIIKDIWIVLKTNCIYHMEQVALLSYQKP